MRRRFSDFEWLRNELERGSKVTMLIDFLFKMEFSFDTLEMFRLLIFSYLKKYCLDSIVSFNLNDWFLIASNVFIYFRFY